jgi:hypothetical protein
MENQLERPGYYAVLPAAVRYDKALTSNAKLLFAEITALTNKTGTCWASNAYFAELYGVNVDAVSKWVKQLVDAGYLTTKVNKAAGNKRYLRLAFTDPIMNFHGSSNENSLDNTKTNTVSKDTGSASLTKQKNDLLALVNRVIGRSFRTLPEKGVKKTLDAFSLEEIEIALTALSRDELWHKDKLKELSLDYLIRSTTIDKWLQLGQKTGIKDKRVYG